MFAGAVRNKFALKWEALKAVTDNLDPWEPAILPVSENPVYQALTRSGRESRVTY